MAAIRGRDTRPELILRQALWARGYRFRLRQKLPGSPDLVFRRVRVAVFVDGCFWHGCPLHYRRPPRNTGYWDRKLERNILRDRRTDAELEKAGWTVVRIWEHEVIAELPQVIERVRIAVTLFAGGIAGGVEPHQGVEE